MLFTAAKCLDTIMQLHGKLPVVAQWLRASLMDTLLSLSGPGTCSDIYLPTLGNFYSHFEIAVSSSQRWRTGVISRGTWKQTAVGSKRNT